MHTVSRQQRRDRKQRQGVRRQLWQQQQMDSSKTQADIHASAMTQTRCTLSNSRSSAACPSDARALLQAGREEAARKPSRSPLPPFAKAQTTCTQLQVGTPTHHKLIHSCGTPHTVWLACSPIVKCDPNDAHVVSVQHTMTEPDALPGSYHGSCTPDYFSEKVQVHGMPLTGISR